MQRYTVDESEIDRVDTFLQKKIPTLSRATIQKLSKQDLVKINGKISKASDKVKTNDKVILDFNQYDYMKLPDIDLPIIYEDKDCLVINKPEGVITHSKGNFNPEATVSTFVSSKVGLPLSDRAGIVHRLDRPTSGVIICAKNDEALKFLQKQFSERKVKKTYIAIVKGHLKDRAAIIDMPIERNPKAPSTFRTGPNGKSAMTSYEVIESTKNYDLVKLSPKTGRTHQLRVHLAAIGHPILGDDFYKGDKAERMFLHALSLELQLPDMQFHKFDSELPKIFNDKIKNDE